MQLMEENGEDKSVIMLRFSEKYLHEMRKSGKSALLWKIFHLMCEKKTTRIQAEFNKAIIIKQIVDDYL